METKQATVLYLLGFSSQQNDLPENIYGISLLENVWALCQDVPVGYFGELELKENIKDLAWVSRQAAWHDQRLQTLLSNRYVLPVRFATVFYSPDSLRKSLLETAHEIEQKLKDLAGKYEWNVRLFVADDISVKEKVIGDDPELHALDQQISSANAGRAYLLKKKFEQAYQQGFRRWLANFSVLLESQLKQQQVECKPLPIPKIEEDSANPKLLLANYAILLPCLEKAVAADHLSNLLVGIDGIEVMELSMNGPLPPYHFN